ncbi:uncharacterized protein LOC135211888 [Macrobrachium nipponense]|uniref:uncharacterized protein LOC135211888 n=1 Tax=Macrobrachium nipponense TaxID=159736 RepID=UPI0030C7EE78
MVAAIEAQMDYHILFLSDSLLHAQRDLLELHSVTAYQDLLDRILADEQQLQTLYLTTMTKIELVDLDDIAKFTYLLRSLKGKLLRVVQALSITVADYNVALNLLDRYYGNQHQALVMLHRWSANIFVPKFNNIKLREFRIELSVLIEQIKHLSGSALDQGMLLSLINQKLSQSHVYQKVVEYLHKCDYSLDELLETLDFLIRYYEDDTLQKGEDLSRSSQLKVLESSASRSTSCPFCNIDHSAFSCQQYPKKHQLVLVRKCFNSLASGHSSKQYSSKRNYKISNGRHHSLICESSSNKSKLGPSPHQIPYFQLVVNLLLISQQNPLET